MTNILIGSPIHQKPSVLKEFLSSLKGLIQSGFQFSYLFIDDNEDSLSSKMLIDFQKEVDHVDIQLAQNSDRYICDTITHQWNEHLIWKVAGFKNKLIQKAIENESDYLFLIDSDLVLHSNTIEQLVLRNKDIISEIFWTKWQPNAEPQPQVWLSDEYTQWEQARGEHLSKDVKAKRYNTFIKNMRTPGVYEVGGLGACTLISRKALLAGVNFKQIPNLSFWGEDRHFCIRAASLGIPLYVDTHLPAFHIYRESDLEKVQDFISNQKKHVPAAQLPSTRRPKLTLSMVVKNESLRYLTQVLKEHRKYIDNAVIIDDGSSDNSAEICLDILDGLPVYLVRNHTSMFADEVELRKLQWNETLKTNPEWILNLDADEQFEAKFSQDIHALLQQDQFDVFSFRLFDFWNKTHYREDTHWKAHLTYRPFLMRYRKSFNAEWNETPQHCGRFPKNIYDLPNGLSDLRMKHFGWADQNDRLEKFQRYLELDPNASYGSKEQYLSILDESPQLIEWIE